MCESVWPPPPPLTALAAAAEGVQASKRAIERMNDCEQGACARGGGANEHGDRGKENRHRARKIVGFLTENSGDPGNSHRECPPDEERGPVNTHWIFWIELDAGNRIQGATSGSVGVREDKAVRDPTI